MGFKYGQNEETINRTGINVLSFSVRDSGGGELPNWSNEIVDSAFSWLPVEILGTTLSLKLYPQEFHRTQPNRVDTNQLGVFTENFDAKGDMDVWGPSVPQWFIKGHTGFTARNINGTPVDGYQYYMGLYNFFMSYMKENIYRLKMDRPLPPVRMLLNNWADSWQDLWYVEPMALPTKIRTAERPMLYMYEIHFIGVIPYVGGDLIPDAITTSIANTNARLLAVARSLMNQIGQLGLLRGFIPSSLVSQYDNLSGDLGTFNAGLLSGPTNAASVLSTLSQTVGMIGQVDSFARNCVTQIAGPLSPLYQIMHTVKQIKCGLLTLSQLPIDIYGDLKNDVKDLISCVTASGCGTTLSTSNIGSFHSYPSVLGR
jgi:hypothetical protein